ncbi:uncharacterized protein TNCV_669821 [Trichonephila clavipes]|nr:uncharacterized protein TNCV_669821 [Trichonephila clavipes]
MAWPAYSPDLNPIENLWDALGRAVSSRFPPPATLIELENVLQEEWRLLSSAVADHLIEHKGRVVVYRASPPQVLGSINGLGKVDSAFHPRYIGSINEYQACLGS